MSSLKLAACGLLLAASGSTHNARPIPAGPVAHFTLSRDAHWSQVHPVRYPGKGLQHSYFGSNLLSFRISPRSNGPEIRTSEVEAGVLYFNSPGNRPITVSSAHWSQIHWVGQCAIAFTVTNGSGISFGWWLDHTQPFNTIVCLDQIWSQTTQAIFGLMPAGLPEWSGIRTGVCVGATQFLPSLILLAFSGASPISQLLLRLMTLEPCIIYNAWQSYCQVIILNYANK